MRRRGRRVRHLPRTSDALPGGRGAPREGIHTGALLRSLAHCSGGRLCPCAPPAGFCLSHPPSDSAVASRLAQWAGVELPASLSLGRHEKCCSVCGVALAPLGSSVVGLPADLTGRVHSDHRLAHTCPLSSLKGLADRVPTFDTRDLAVTLIHLAKRFPALCLRSL